MPCLGATATQLSFHIEPVLKAENPENIASIIEIMWKQL